METQTKTHTPKHRFERPSASGSRLRAGMRSAALLLRRPHKALHKERKGTVQIAASELVSKPLMSEGEELAAPMERTLLKNDSLNVVNRKPLLSGDQVRLRIGVDLGPLQAVVYPEGDTPRILCFDRSYLVDGERHARYMMVTDDQLGDIQRLTYSNEAMGHVREQSMRLKKPGQRMVVGVNHPMPGQALRPEILHDDDGKVKNPMLAGEVVISLTKWEYPGLKITDLGGGEGTLIDHSAEFISAQDPWAGHPL